MFVFDTVASHHKSSQPINLRRGCLMPEFGMNPTSEFPQRFVKQPNTACTTIVCTVPKNGAPLAGTWLANLLPAFFTGDNLSYSRVVLVPK
jgi:hypothetical protein